MLWAQMLSCLLYSILALASALFKQHNLRGNLWLALALLRSIGRFPSLARDLLEPSKEGKLVSLSLEPGTQRVGSFCTLNLPT